MKTCTRLQSCRGNQEGQMDILAWQNDVSGLEGAYRTFKPFLFGLIPSG